MISVKRSFGKSVYRLTPRSIQLVQLVYRMVVMYLKLSKMSFH